MEAVAQHCYDRTQFQVTLTQPRFIDLVKTILYVVFHKKIGDETDMVKVFVCV